MPTSPRTPGHSRGASNVDDNIPMTPARHSLGRSDSLGIDVFSSGGPTESNGLGNLADELADAWDEEEEEEEPDMNFQEIPEQTETQQDAGVDPTRSPVAGVDGAKRDNLTPPTNGKHHRRQGSEYDGSDYGVDSDMDSTGIPPALVAQMDMVESLVRRGTESNGTDDDEVVKRVVDNLKDLGGQSGVEGGATRLITAHTALATHLHHQTRLLHSLTYTVFSPLRLPPSEETVDDMLPLLLTISESMPRPTTAALSSLSQLHALTADLVQTLNYLSDTLYMSRQTTTTATRRLKSARELVADMRRDEEVRDEGERWLRRGNWSERLGNRECAGVCGEVVGGFEEVCNGWRARLVAQAEAVGA
ncbi:MAG: hypothetical protein M1818_005553 [Claussenomyces sp. TS43310]|nr:MAG: hypothetical protein M1818_005553 [Claussenomyces sp. TS43310]